MSEKNPMPATDSARDLRNLVHDDVTADFEADPKFVDSNPTDDAASENRVMRDTDDEEDSDDELEDEDEEEDEYEGDDEDPEAEDDDDEEEEEDEYDDDDEDEVDEDDEDEVGSSDPSRLILKRAA